MSIKLDLKGFKFVSGDKDSTTLRHAKHGHMVTLAHKVLSPENQQILKAMCSGGMSHYDEGGKVPMPSQTPDTPAPSTTEKPVGANVNTPSSLGEAWQRLTHPMAKGGKIRYDDGGIVDTMDRVPASQQTSESGPNQDKLKGIAEVFRGKPAAQAPVKNPSDYSSQLDTSLPANRPPAKQRDDRFQVQDVTPELKAEGGSVQNQKDAARRNNALPYKLQDIPMNPQDRQQQNQKDAAKRRRVNPQQYAKGGATNNSQMTMMNRDLNGAQYAEGGWTVPDRVHLAEGDANLKNTPEYQDKLAAENSGTRDDRPDFSKFVGETASHAFNTMFKPGPPGTMGGQPAQPQAPQQAPGANPGFNSVTGKMDAAQQPPTPDNTEMPPSSNEDQDIDKEVNNNEATGQQLAAPGNTNPAMAAKINAPDTYGNPQQANAAAQGQPQQQQAPQVEPISPSQPGEIDRLQMQGYTPQQTQQAIASKYMQEDQDWQHDLNNGHITPKTYHDLFADKSTPGKIASIFGLLVSGMGSGLAHQPNLALQMMDKTIQNDLEAQKTNKANAYNFKSLNQQRLMQQGQLQKMVQEGKLTESQAALTMQQANVESDTLHQMQANRAALNDMRLMAEKAGPNSPAAQAYQLAAMSVDAKNGDLASRAAGLAMTLHATGAKGQDPETAFQNRQEMLQMSGHQDMAKAEQEYHLPGVGTTSQPVTSDDVKTFATLNNLEKSYKDAHDFITNPSVWRKLPLTDQYALGKSLESHLTVTAGQLEGLNRFTPEEVSFYRSEIPKLSGMHLTNEDRTKTEELMRRVAQKKNDFLQSMGVDKSNPAYRKNTELNSNQTPVQPKMPTATDANGNRIQWNGSSWTPFKGP